MARSKKVSATVPVAGTNDASVDVSTYTPTISTTEATVQPVEEFTKEELNAEFQNTVPGVGASSSLYEQRQAQVVNLIGPSIDMDAVIAKHLEASAPGAPGSSKVPVSRSSVVRPVKLVHVIASEMYAKNSDVQRKDVIKACEDAGIATHTARTQYQVWHQAMKSDLAVKAAQAAAPKTVAQSLSGALDKNTAERKARK